MNKTGGHLTLKLFALILLNDVIDTIAQFFMKKGVVGTGLDSVTLTNISAFVIKIIPSGFMWLGIFFYALNFVVWIVILYKVDLSIAMPVGSTSYIFIPIMAMLFLHEHISVLRWVGILLIILGIHFVSQSKKPAKEESQAHA